MDFSGKFYKISACIETLRKISGRLHRLLFARKISYSKNRNKWKWPSECESNLPLPLLGTWWDLGNVIQKINWSQAAIKFCHRRNICWLFLEEIIFWLKKRVKDQYFFLSSFSDLNFIKYFHASGRTAVWSFPWFYILRYSINAFACSSIFR